MARKHLFDTFAVFEKYRIVDQKRNPKLCQTIEFGRPREQQGRIETGFWEVFRQFEKSSDFLMVL